MSPGSLTAAVPTSLSPKAPTHTKPTTIQQPKKSPPLAFEPTPNDSLAPFISSFQHRATSPLPSPRSSGMGRQGANAGDGRGLKNVIDKQAKAIQLLHAAFDAEREAWSYERESLHERIASLEKLLKADSGHSPAKSPTSPSGSTNGLASPQSRATNAPPRLASIAEDENLTPLSQRRQNAPQSIDLPDVISAEGPRPPSLVFDESIATHFDELTVSPPPTARALSPLPPDNVAMAGHTPLRATLNRPPTPPPKDMMLDGIEDTPTRNNTHINTLLTRSNDSQEDVGLTGPLNMPELPGQPGEHNFTEEMLFKRLEQIAQSPGEHMPLIFAEPSPGLLLPEDYNPMDQTTDAQVVESSTEGAIAPKSSHNPGSQSQASSNALSPTNAPLSPQEQQEAAVHNNFAQGGIRLKKKPSSNFGAPFGQLSGFGGIRRPS